MTVGGRATAPKNGARPPAGRPGRREAHHPHIKPEEQDMAWTKPAAVDMRYGFEINLYVGAR